jgi:hypothetical protein
MKRHMGLLFGPLAAVILCGGIIGLAFPHPLHNVFGESELIGGLVQRSLFAAWFGWCAVIGVMLWRRAGP